MGRGNSCVHGDYEGLYYVGWDNFSSEHEDENGELATDYYLQHVEWEESLAQFILDFTEKYKSFYESHGWRGNSEKIIIENSLFYIVIEDNEWSMAIKLIQKEQDYYERGNIEGLQANHYQTYLEGMKECLFRQFEELGVYGGPWTSGIIKRAA